MEALEVSLREPVVSVVVSACDRPEMLQTALDSVVNQTLQDIEIIVQDDSSGDGCEEVVRKIEDARIQYTRNRPPLGTAINLRAGYRKCRGKYFSTLNDDDFYAPVYLGAMVSILEANPKLSLAFSDHYIVDSKGGILSDESDCNSENWGRSKLKEGIVPDCIRVALIDKAVPGMFAVFRSEVMDLDDFPDEAASGYDFWMTYLGVRDGGPIYYNPARLTFYRVHEGSQSASFREPERRLYALEYGEFIWRRLLADARVASIWPELRQRLAETCATSGFDSLRLVQRRRSLSYFGASMRMHPNRRALAGIILGLIPAFVFKLLDRKS